MKAKGPRNSQWKGGRVIASNGYVLVRVGVDHPLADVRGYAYEHRIKAAEKLGRQLAPHEQVHHIDGDKQNNHPDNLEVHANAASHRAEHRRAGSTRRLPEQPNDTVTCRCGCGSAFQRFDDGGRPRAYVSGHNPSDSPTQDALLANLRPGPRTARELASATGIGQRAVSVCLSKMRTRGLVDLDGRAQAARWAVHP